MDQTPPISVIIPCFNYGRFLPHCLSSVSAQTLKPVETLIIDDGSTDPDTLRVLKEIADLSVTVIHQENRGLAGARNTGLRHATGEYVYFLDADDMMFPSCLERLAKLLDDNSEAIAACSGVQILGGNQNGAVWLPFSNRYVILVRNLWAAGLMLRKHAVYKHSLWYDESMRNGYEDWEFNIRLTRAGHQVEVFPGALYFYRVHGQSMLTDSRKLHSEIITYIRNKHHDAYVAKDLVTLKQECAPALTIFHTSQEHSDIKRWITSQSFNDCIFSVPAAEAPRTPYYLFHAGVPAVYRLPREAIETGLMYLEANRSQSGCVLAIRANGSPLALGKRWREEQYQPVAVIVKSHVASCLETPSQIVNKCKQILHFSDCAPGTGEGWDLVKTEVRRQGKWGFDDFATLRKDLRTFGERVLGIRFKGWCVKLYDRIYYNILLSDSALSFRKTISRYFGKKAEHFAAKIVYGFFLTEPESIDEPTTNHFRVSNDSGVPPLFLDLKRQENQKYNLLIVTAWLNQGGVEQEIVDLCSHLDQSRFNIIVATTRRSGHPWENLVRRCGANVYHLGDFPNRRKIQTALAQLIIAHHVDVLHILHSKEAYEGLTVIKQACPYLCISDRNVTIAGGFPKLSARIADNFIDQRTVGHRGLAEYMFTKFGVPLESLRVVYAGTDMRRVEQALSGNRRRLHAMCNIAPDLPIVLYIGRLETEKRPVTFIRSAEKILKEQPNCDAHFVLVGDGELRKDVQKVIYKLRMNDRVHMLGFQVDALDLLADSTVLMITSAFEGLALVSFEAMALGVPQISADVGGQHELITPETGILIRNGPREIARYAHACLDLLSNPLRRARMAAAGKERIKKHFTAENAVMQYAQIFEEMAELSRKRAAEIPHLRPPHINPLRELA